MICHLVVLAFAQEVAIHDGIQAPNMFLKKKKKMNLKATFHQSLIISTI